DVRRPDREVPLDIVDSRATGRRFSGPPVEISVQNGPARAAGSGERSNTTAACSMSWDWRRRPDLNRGRRFCRFHRVLHVVDSSCSLVCGIPRFLAYFGRSWTEVGLNFYLASRLSLTRNGTRTRRSTTGSAATFKVISSHRISRADAVKKTGDRAQYR